jgi:predicted phosphohydrolase
MNDVHFDHFVENPENTIPDFAKDCASVESDGIVICGDISNGLMLEKQMNQFVKGIKEKKLFFVLGNHDFFKSSFKGMRKKMSKYDGSSGAYYLTTQTDPIQLDDNTCIIGHDGWYDGGYSNWFSSKLRMNDYDLIEEMNGKQSTELYAVIQEQAKAFQTHMELMAPKIEKYKRVIIITHVPPFKENSTYNGKISDRNWLPCMSSKCSGDAILGLANKYQDKEFLVFSGHTHGSSTFSPLKNVKSKTYMAQYGYPNGNVLTF